MIYKYDNTVLISTGSGKGTTTGEDNRSFINLIPDEVEIIEE